MKLRLLRLCIFALMMGAIVLTACSTASGKPTVVIASPPSGSQFKEGDDVAVQSTSGDAAGVVRIELDIDGAVVRNDTPPSPQTNFPLIQIWKATPGSHTVTVRAYNAAGVSSDAAAVSIQVSPSVALASTPTATASPQSNVTVSTPTATSTLTTINAASSTPTNTPPNTPTNTPNAPAPTACPGPPVIASFTASPQTINAGDATTLNWGAITNAASASIDQGVGGIAAPGSKSGVKPGGTTTYKLTATGCGGTATSQVTVTVNPPAPKAPVTVQSVSNFQNVPPAGGQGQSTMPCPSGTQVTGGGFATVSIVVSVFNNQLAGNGWTAGAINDTSASHAVFAFAVCATNLAGKITRVFGAFTKVNGGGSIGEAPSANCPSGNVLVGGGFFMDSPLQVTYSGPAGGNTGWTASAVNNGSSQIGLAAIAVCYDGSASPSPTVKSTNVGGSQGADIHATCAAGAVVTGGGFKADPGMIVIQSSPDGSTGWDAEGSNVTGGPKELQAIAICTKF